MMSAAPGTGTVTPAHVVTSRAWSTPISSTKPCSRIGSGASVSPRSRRYCVTCSMWRNVLICAETSTLADGWWVRPSTSRASAGPWRPAVRRFIPRNSWCWLPVACRLPTCLRSRAVRCSRGRSTTPGNGRTSPSISAANGWPWWVPGRRRSSRFHSLQNRPASCGCSSAPPVIRCQRTTHRWTRRWKPR